MFIPWDTPKLFAAVLGVTVLAVGIWGASTSIPAFGVYNPTWEGSSDLRQEADATGAEQEIAVDVETYSTVDADETIAVILAPTEPYTDEESAKIRQFIERGGTVLVAAEVGTNANPLLRSIGASTRIDGRPVRDERNYYRSPNLTVATDVASTELTGGTESLTLNHGTVLRPNGATAIVNTSSFAYVDANRNATLDETESLGQYSVVTTERIGDGRVIAVSDPSVFINAMLDREGNHAFVEALFSGASTVLFDYSHRSSVPPFVRAVLAFRRSPLLQVAIGLAFVGAVALVSDRLSAPRSNDPDSASSARPFESGEFQTGSSSFSPMSEDTATTDVMTDAEEEVGDD